MISNQELKNFVEKYLKNDEKIILACSGGADSIFLYFKFLEIFSAEKIVLCYFNHGWRKEAFEEEKYLENLAKEKGSFFETEFFNLPEIKKSEKSISSEELARKFRYEFLEKIRKKYFSESIFTAHHLDDKIETFFINLFRGSKIHGLVNMTENSGNILRPLLEIRKSEVLKYLKENNISYFEDFTNSDKNISKRNFLRLEIIPKIEELNSSATKNISQTLEYFSELQDFLDKKVFEFLENQDENLEYFYKKDFLDEELFFQKEIIKYIFRIKNNNSSIGLTSQNLEEFLKLINSENGNISKSLKNLKIYKIGKKIFFS